MNIFITWLGPIMAISIGIMVLTVFFKIIKIFSKKSYRIKTKKIKGFVDRERYLNVYLSSGKIIPTVKFSGFINESFGKSFIPFHFANMVVFRSATDQKVLIRPDSIRVIEEIKQEVE